MTRRGSSSSNEKKKDLHGDLGIFYYRFLPGEDAFGPPTLTKGIDRRKRFRLPMKSEVELHEGLLIKSCYDKNCDEHDCIIVYLHGFPDLSVNPSNPDEFSSRFPLKCSELMRLSTSSVFVCFNFSGCPGSDIDFKFEEKTISFEIQDTIKVIDYAKQKFQCEHVHLIGLSTGAIIAALLRNRIPNMKSITVIAGLLNIENTIQYDFTPEQLKDFETKGYCMKEFYLPEEKVYFRLNRTYLEDCKQLCIRKSVENSSVPLLVIHGTEDRNVPIQNGKELYEAAAPPKKWLEINKANHLVTNSKHMKKLASQVKQFISENN